MNYYEAREIKGEDGNGTGLFHFARNGVPTGYCSPWETCPDCKGKCPPLSFRAKDCPTCGNRGFVNSANPCPGHPAKEKAAEHYRQYLLDHRVRYSKMSNQQLKCRVCGVFTDGYAELDCQMIVLCDEHRNRAELEKLVEPSSFIMSSW